MLKFTRKIEYALIALRHIQAAGPGAICSAREISKQYNIPFQLLAKILQELGRKKIIEPIQGPTGGYKLLADLETLSLTDFLEALEGPLGIMNCYLDENCNVAEMCNIRSPIKRINENVRSMFDKITVYDVTH